MLLRCELTRKEAIFLRKETFEQLARRPFGNDDKCVFIRMVLRWAPIKELLKRFVRFTTR
jgi:hypothetical protein